MAISHTAYSEYHKGRLQLTNDVIMCVFLTDANIIAGKMSTRRKSQFMEVLKAATKLACSIYVNTPKILVLQEAKAKYLH
jgi:hypothetical protein